MLVYSAQTEGVHVPNAVEYERLASRARKAKNVFSDAAINHFCLQAELAHYRWSPGDPAVVVVSPAMMTVLRDALDATSWSNEEVLVRFTGMARSFGFSFPMRLRASHTSGLGPAIIIAG